MNNITERKEIVDKLKNIKEVDILIGIPSYNNADTIGNVVMAVQVGLNKYFPDKKSLIVNSDGGSRDGTRELVENIGLDDSTLILMKHRIRTIHKIWNNNK